MPEPGTPSRASRRPDGMLWDEVVGVYCPDNTRNINDSVTANVTTAAFRRRQTLIGIVLGFLSALIAIVNFTIAVIAIRHELGLWLPALAFVGFFAGCFSLAIRHSNEDKEDES